MSELSPANPDACLHGPITIKRRKADLVYIAAQLGLDSAGTVPVLAKRINDYIKQNPNEIATSFRFQRLVSYRPEVIQKAESKETGKNSADKDRADAVENNAKSSEPTG